MKHDYKKLKYCKFRKLAAKFRIQDSHNFAEILLLTINKCNFKCKILLNIDN